MAGVDADYTFRRSKGVLHCVYRMWERVCVAG